MAFRVVVYAEGANEIVGPTVLPPAPGSALEPETWGPLHVLVERLIAECTRWARGAVVFEEGLRLGRGRVPRGSDLLVRQNLRQLLSWANHKKRPDLAVVLIDRDGDGSRKQILEGHVQDVPGNTVVGVAREVVEAWFVSDHVTAGRVLATTLPTTADPEVLSAREAKETLERWIAVYAPRQSTESAAERGRRVRRTLAAEVDLAVLAKRCRSFEEFAKDLEGRTTGSH